eukprot:4685566-Pyramimonas_sp.AAC.1
MEETPHSMQPSGAPDGPRLVLGRTAAEHAQETGALKDIDLAKRTGVPSQTSSPVQQRRLNKRSISATLGLPGNRSRRECAICP